MPVRACNRCAAVPRACRCPKRRPERRAYSGTAEDRAMREAVLETYGDVCVYCRELIDLQAPPRSDRSLALAHVIAHADGGLFELENLRPAHLDCNRAAGRRPITGGPTDGR